MNFIREYGTSVAVSGNLIHVFISLINNLKSDDHMNKSIVILCVMVSMFVFAGFANADLMDGLSAFYALDGTTNDMSGNGNNAINHGANTTEVRFNNPG